MLQDGEIEALFVDCSVTPQDSLQVLLKDIATVITSTMLIMNLHTPSVYVVTVMHALTTAHPFFRCLSIFMSPISIEIYDFCGIRYKFHLI